jgi:hypothetical protein
MGKILDSRFFAEGGNNVMTLLKISLQLLPDEEMALLDDLYRFHLQSDAKNE